MPVRPVLAALAAIALALGLAAPTLATADDRPRAELPATASDRARQALADVRAIFEGDRAGAARSSAHSGREATLALRDLLRFRAELTGADRRAAHAYLARPTDGASDPMGDGYAASATPHQACTSSVCVHWVETSRDRVPLADDSGNGRPDYVDSVLATLQLVHETYVDAGYRAPMSDKGREGNNKPDVYLSNIGETGAYGYCTSDAPRIGPPWNVWAYCVLDNDYDEFTNQSRLDNMRVTAAHEYFHAVQFAYDIGEDGWFMEATATWAEDEVFDSIDDSLQYLEEGPLGRPRVPLDKFEPAGSHQYGDWIFFRYLTERFPVAEGELPTLVRDAWGYADGSTDGPDMYSMQAVRTALRDRGTSFPKVFTQFADANRRADEVYAEGAVHSYPSAPVWQSRTLSPSGPSASLVVDQLDHQASATARFRPSGLTKSDWKLKIKVRMADKVRGSRAIVTEYRDGLAFQTRTVTLDSSGDGQLTVPFSSTAVSAVEVSLVNASTRMNCWRSFSSPYSCLGTPRDDNLTERVTVTARR